MAHVSLGWCAWDLPALIVLVAIVVIFIVHRSKMKKREKQFNEELAGKSADVAVDAAMAKK